MCHLNTVGARYIETQILQYSDIVCIIVVCKASKVISVPIILNLSFVLLLKRRKL